MKKILSLAAFSALFAGLAFGEPYGYQYYGKVGDWTPVVTNAEQAMEATVERLRLEDEISEERVRSEMNAGTNRLDRELREFATNTAEQVSQRDLGTAKRYADDATNRVSRDLEESTSNTTERIAQRTLGEARRYADDATNDAVRVAKDYADSVAGASSEGGKAYTDNVVSQALETATLHTDNATNELAEALTTKFNTDLSRMANDQTNLVTDLKENFQSNLTETATGMTNDYNRMSGDLRTELRGKFNTATNAMFQHLGQVYRPIADNYIYASLGMSDWEYECQDRPEILQYMKDNDCLPHLDYYDEYYDEEYWYSYFNYEDWYCDIWFNCTRTEPTAAFYVSMWRESWNEEYEYWDYESDGFYIYGTRKPNGFDLDNPIDELVGRSELNGINSKISTLQSQVATETLTMRTGERYQYGTGYGYFQRPAGSDMRYWKIKAPKITESATLPSVTSYLNPFYDIEGTSYNHYALQNPFSTTDLKDYYKFGRKLIETREAAGTDSVKLADFEIGFIMRNKSNADAGYYLNYRLRNISLDTENSRRIFEVTPLTDGLFPTTVTLEGASKEMLMAPLDLPIGHGRSYAYLESAYGYMHSKLSCLYVEPTSWVATNSVTFTFYLKDSLDWRDTSQTSSQPSGTIRYQVQNVLRKLSVSISVNTGSTTTDSYILPGGTVMTSDKSNLFYDEQLHCTWEIAVSNGCFFSTIISDRDWRTEEIVR